MAFWDKSNKRAAPLAISAEEHTIPNTSAYQVRLHEVPDLDSPSTVVVIAKPPNTQVYVETTNLMPTTGKFHVNYNNGVLTFDTNQKDLIILVSYQGTGSVPFAEDVNDIQDLLEAHKDNHDPEDGIDPLDTAAPGGILAQDTAAAKGSSHSFARADHTHSLDVGVPSSIGTSNTEGSSTEFCKKDHQHNHPDLASDLHTVYSLAAGTRAFSGIVSYDTDKTFTGDKEIIAKKYVDDIISGLPKPISQYGSIITVATSNAEYTDLLTAISAASSGDVIMIFPGSYILNAAINADKSLTFVGMGNPEGSSTQIKISRSGGNILVDVPAGRSYDFYNLLLGSGGDMPGYYVRKNTNGNLRFNSCYFQYALQNTFGGSISCYFCNLGVGTDLQVGTLNAYNCEFASATLTGSAVLNLHNSNIEGTLSIGDASGTPICRVYGASYIATITRTNTNATLDIRGILHTTSLGAGCTITKTAGAVLSKLSEDLDANGKTITGLKEPPTADTEAATKKYVDDNIIGAANKSLYTFVWSVPGTLGTGDNQGPWHTVPKDLTITDVEMVVKGAPNAATGVRIDIMRDNQALLGNAPTFAASVFSTKPMIDNGQYSSEPSTTSRVLNLTTLSKGEMLQLDIDVVNTATDLTVILICKAALIA